jgi:hypothetical protein
LIPVVLADAALSFGNSGGPLLSEWGTSTQAIYRRIKVFYVGDTVWRATSCF